MLSHIQATDICEHCHQQFADHNYVPDSIDVYECPHEAIIDSGYGYGCDRSRPDCFSPDHECCSAAELGSMRPICLPARIVGHRCILAQSTKHVQAALATRSRSNGV
jgi:hypothetical protein